VTLVKERFIWVDIAKAISIFGVVYIHTEALEISSIDSGSYFRFGVPIFIIVSFFLSERYLQTQNNYSKKNFLQKRLFRLAIPYVVWSTVYAIGQFYLGIKSTIDFGLVFAWQGQYFFVVLIQLTIIYPWIRLAQIDKKIIFLFLVMTITFLYLPSNYLGVKIPFIFSGQAPFFYWCFYQLLAIYLARNTKKIADLLNSIPSFLIMLIVVFLPLIIVAEDFYIKSQFAYLRVSVLLISSVLTILFVRLNLHIKPLDIGINMLSKYSLGIFCLNPIILTLIRNITRYSRLEDIFFSQIPVFMSRFILASIACIIIIPICLLLEKVRCGLLVK